MIKRTVDWEVARRGRHAGFTLVEMLVAMALTLFLLSILAGAFSASSKVFSDMKAIGDMNERLRTVGRTLRTDLSSGNQFIDYDSATPLPMKVSNCWQNGIPDRGFFRVWHQGASTSEGTESGVTSYRSTGHALHFTVKLPAATPTDVFRASITDPNTALSLRGTINDSGGATISRADSRFQTDTSGSGAPFVYTSQWAEVAYFLRPLAPPLTGTTELADGTTQLYALYRRQRLTIPPGAAPVGIGAGTNYEEVSSFGGTCNTPTQLTVPQRRFNMNASYYPSGTGSVYQTLQDPGMSSVANNLDDLLLNDVISFDVRCLFWENIGTAAPAAPAAADLDALPARFIDLFDATPSFNAYVANYVNALTSGERRFNDTGMPRVYDTWSRLDDSTTAGSENFSVVQPVADHRRIPLYQRTDSGGTTRTLSLRAIQIIIRVWDFKTQQTRQVTIVQDL